MKAMIIGGHGFVGLNTSAALLRRNEQVCIAGLPPSAIDADEYLSRLPGRVASRELDVCDADAVKGLVASVQPDVIIYAAAITPKPEREVRSASAVVDVNIGGLTRCLDAMVPWPSMRFVFIGSSAVFGAADCSAWGEDQPHAPRSLYAITKSAGEAIALRWSEVHSRPISIARLGWVYGPFERESGHRDTLSAIHQLTAMARQGGSAVLPRDAEIDWLYGPDAGEAVARIAARGPTGSGSFHIGPGERWPLSGWCRLLEARYPAFSWRVAADPNIGLHSERDDPPLLNDRFQRAYGPMRFRGLESAFTDYDTWLSQRPTPSSPNP